MVLALALLPFLSLLHFVYTSALEHRGIHLLVDLLTPTHDYRFFIVRGSMGESKTDVPGKFRLAF